MLTVQDVLALNNLETIRRLSSRAVGGRMLTAEEITHILKMCDAAWLHSGDPQAPHAELTSGKHSNGFVDALRALRYTTLCDLFAHQMVMKLEEQFPTAQIDWVVGSDHAAAAFSHSVATWLDAQHDFTEKGSNGQQLWNRFPIDPDKVVLQAEELMTTAGTLLAVRQGIRAGTPDPVTFAPFVAVFVHRSGVQEVEGSPVLHLVHYDIAVWDPGECPLCKGGSKALRPKQNWAELTGAR